MPKRKLPLLAAAAAFLLVAALPARAAEDGFSPAQKKALEQMIHDYIVANPDILVEGLTAYQKKQQDSELQDFKKNVGKHRDFLTSADTPFGGNPKGSKAVVEFFDYNCGYCKHAADDIVALIKSDPQVKVYFKDMPILSASSQDASRWALAAGKQGKYYEYHIAMMHNNNARTVSTYKEVGEKLGLDLARLEKDAEDDKGISEAIEKNLNVARDLGIHGTPGFVIGDTLFPGYMGEENMKKAVADEYKAK